MSDKKAAFLVAAIAGALLTAAAVLPSSGIRPYGEDAILKQITQEDGALCPKFAAGHQDLAQCTTELADLRQRHERLLTAFGWH